MSRGKMGDSDMIRLLRPTADQFQPHKGGWPTLPAVSAWLDELARPDI